MFGCLKGLFIIGTFSESFFMNEFYYDVTYMETKNGQMVNSNSMLIQSTTDLPLDDIKDFIRGKIGKLSAVISLPRVEKIDKETYLARGGETTSPWLKG